MPEQEQVQTCALRALTLCDGQVLEDPDRGLTMCLCDMIDVFDRWGCDPEVQLTRQDRQVLIERTMTAQAAPLPRR